MTIATWIAVAVCGPGAFAVFVWFLADLLRLRLRHRRRARGDADQEK